MSDYLAVAGASAVLRSMLTNALPAGPSTILGATPGVTASSPDLIKTGPDEQPQLNLFMYYLSLNAALRNLDLPSSNGNGAAVSNPPLALNLHYLVCAYGGNQFDPEILLAWAMKVFHDTPVVPAQTIQDALDALATQTSAEAKLVGGSTLASQIEHLRITPETLTTEEIYRLWAAFEAPYRPSTALQVSVVVIQDTRQFTSNLPVQTRTVKAQPLTPPAIAAIAPTMATAGELLTITGSNFLGDVPSDTLVSFDSAPGVPADVVRGNLVEVPLPPTLQAGTRFARVQRRVTFPGSSALHPGFSSGSAPFQLIPTIEDASPVQATVGGSLTLTISPVVGRAQQAVLYIGDQAIPIDQRPLSGPSVSSTVTFPIPASVPTGTFPLRVEIDGAASQPGPQVQVKP